MEGLVQHSTSTKRTLLHASSILSCAPLGLYWVVTLAYDIYFSSYHWMLYSKSMCHKYEICAGAHCCCWWQNFWLVMLVSWLTSTVCRCIKCSCSKVNNILITHGVCKGWRSCYLLLLLSIHLIVVLFISFVEQLDVWNYTHLIFCFQHLHAKLFVHAVHQSGNMILCIIFIIT